MMSVGLPFGAQSPCQTDRWKPGSPASSTDGIWRAAANRLVLATAKALTFLERTKGTIGQELKGGRNRLDCHGAKQSYQKIVASGRCPFHTARRRSPWSS